MSETVKNSETQITPGKGKRIIKAILNAIINVLIVIVLITSILIAVMSLTSKSSGISTIFGYTIQPIQSDSMKGGSPDGYPEGDFGQGDLMIAKATDFDPNAEYDIGDIITFVTKDTDGETSCGDSSPAKAAGEIFVRIITITSIREINLFLFVIRIFIILSISYRNPHSPLCDMGI